MISSNLVLVVVILMAGKFEQPSSALTNCKYLMSHVVG